MYRFHYVGMPHLPITVGYSSCAFTQKIHKLTRMLLDKGHEVYLYGVGYTDIKHKNLKFFPVVTMEDVVGEWGEGDNRFELGYDWGAKGFKHDLNGDKTECTKKFRKNTVNNINHRKKPDDFLLLSQGYYHKHIADRVGLFLTCEPGIGYRGSYAPFRAFESSYIQNFTYGSEHPRKSINGSYYDRVIPNYFETKDFDFGKTPKDYLFYIGRLIPRKGVGTAMRVADALKMKLYIAGQGSLKDIPFETKYAEHIGAVDSEQRNKWLKGAKVNFLPTMYLEPFGGTSIEANFCGTPSITTNFGVFPETIINGLNGYRCDTLDDFVKNTVKALELDREKIRDYAVGGFSTEAVNEMFEKWWSDLYRVYESTQDSKKKAWHYVSD
jgi:glycosyltransferase involved in cell wall biosynthesis